MLIEAIGFAGVVLYLLGYGLVSFGRLDAQTVTFQLLNVAGSTGVALNALHHGAIPSVVVNVAWCTIAIAALVRIRKLHQARRTADVPE